MCLIKGGGRDKSGGGGGGSYKIDPKIKRGVLIKGTGPIISKKFFQITNYHYSRVPNTTSCTSIPGPSIANCCWARGILRILGH